jgi:hypothetical protein
MARQSGGTGSGRFGRLCVSTVVIAALAVPAFGLVSVSSPSIAGASTPLVITTTSLPNATLGQPYSFTLQATGGVPPYTWGETARFGGSLPPGLTVSSNGTISGTPTEVASDSFGVFAEDGTDIAFQQLTLSVSSGTPALDPTLISVFGALNAVQSEIATLEATLTPNTVVCLVIQLLGERDAALC